MASLQAMKCAVLENLSTTTRIESSMIEDGSFTLKSIEIENHDLSGIGSD
jgi:hypothetical protein